MIRKYQVVKASVILLGLTSIGGCYDASASELDTMRREYSSNCNKPNIFSRIFNPNSFVYSDEAAHICEALQFRIERLERSITDQLYFEHQSIGADQAFREYFSKTNNSDSNKQSTRGLDSLSNSNLETFTVVEHKPTRNGPLVDTLGNYVIKGK